MAEREFKSYTAAKRFKSLMRFHGVDVFLYECRGLLAGRWRAVWQEES